MDSMEQLSAAGMPLASAWELWLILGCTVPCALRNLRLLHLSGGGLCSIDQASDDHMVTHGSFSTNVVGVLAKRGLVFFV